MATILPGGTPDHILRFVADSQNLSGVCVDGNNGRLIHDDSLFSHIDKGIGSTQVNSHIFGIEHHYFFTPFIIGNAAVCAAAMVSLKFCLTFYHTAFLYSFSRKRAVFFHKKKNGFFLKKKERAKSFSPPENHYSFSVNEKTPRIMPMIPAMVKQDGQPKIAMSARPGPA